MRAGIAIRAALATGLLLVATTTWTTPSGAHSEVPGFRNVLDAVIPSVPGVAIEVVTSAADQLVAQNPTSTVLQVVASGGEAFLRISAGGVEANLASPDWYRSATPEGDGRVPSSASAGAVADWVRVSTMSSWGWFDHRLHENRADRAPAAGVGSPGARGSVRLADWTVPMRYGTQDVLVTGHREFARPPGHFRAALTGDLDGIRAGLVDGTVPAVSVAVANGRSLVVLGEGGEPMARVGPSGVEGNLASPTWRLTAASMGAPPDGPVGVAEAPRWQSAGGGSTLTWLEPRARYADARPPEPVVRARRIAVVRRWKIPVEIDGRPAALVGTTSWVPEAAESAPTRGPVGSTSDGGTTGRRGAIAVAVAIAVMAAAVIRGRFRRSAQR